MSNWSLKRAARRVLDWTKEKGKDASINRILPILETLHGSVLEIGPGSGSLLQYLPKNIRYTCIEPNHHLHESIRKEAARCGFFEIEIIAGRAEEIPLVSNSFDAVVSVRSLCVLDTALVLQEIKRVLKSKGRFIFVEHVAAPKGSYLWFVQKVIRYPHKFIKNGCDPAKDIESFIKSAKFDNVEIERFDLDRDISKSRVAGVATK